MVYCKNCGSEVPTGDVCPKCGTLFEAEAEVAQEAVEQIPAKDSGKTLGIVSLILGIAGLVGGCIPIVAYIAPICPIVGLILAIIGMNKSKKAGFKNTMAIVGLILSIVGLLFTIIGIISSLAFGGLWLVAICAPMFAGM